VEQHIKRNCKCQEEVFEKWWEQLLLNYENLNVQMQRTKSKSKCFVYITFVVADDQLLWHAVVLLEKALANSPSNFQFKLLLIQLYSTLGQYALFCFADFLHYVYLICVRCWR